MKKTITKKQVIEALSTESISQRDIFSSNKANCSVCAVGAVLRKVSFEKWLRKYKLRKYSTIRIISIFNFRTMTCYNPDTVNFLLKEKRYLEALSCRFERITVVNSYSIAKLIKWVDDNFPTKFVLESKIPK